MNDKKDDKDVNGTPSTLNELTEEIKAELKESLKTGLLQIVNGAQSLTPVLNAFDEMAKEVLTTFTEELSFHQCLKSMIAEELASGVDKMELAKVILGEVLEFVSDDARVVDLIVGLDIGESKDEKKDKFNEN